MSTPDDTPNNTLVLVIGRPDLANQWQRDSLLDMIEWPAMYADDTQVNTYLSPPYLNLQAIQQLLPSLAHYQELILYVSLLELDHHQVIGILQGLTILLEMASEHRFIELNLEYENGNPEHNDVLQLVTITHIRNLNFRSLIYRNIRPGADPLLLNEGDDGEEMPEDD